MSQLMRRVAKKGFTLIELMIVVAIIGILAAIAIPKFADLIVKSKESSVKGSLGSVRGAITIYYSDTEGVWPGGPGAGGDFTSLTLGGGKYIASVPFIAIPAYNIAGVNMPGHSSLNSIAVAHGDVGNWVYFSTAGTVNVNCSHDDTKTVLWGTY